jgi:hypothetical protein
VVLDTIDDHGPIFVHQQRKGIGIAIQHPVDHGLVVDFGGGQIAFGLLVSHIVHTQSSESMQGLRFCERFALLYWIGWDSIEKGSMRRMHCPKLGCSGVNRR